MTSVSARKRTSTLMALGLLLAMVTPALGPARASRAKRPDLVVAKVGSPPAVVAAGDTFVIKDTTANRGRRKAGRSKTAYFLSADTKPGKGDIALGKRSVKALRPGAKEARKTRLKVPVSTEVRSYYLIACADVGRVVREASEGNNCRRSSPVRIDPELTSMGLIEKAIGKGDLDPETGLTYKTFAAFGDPRLPARFRGAAGVELDGGGALNDVAADWSTLSPGSKATLLPFVTPPAYQGSWAEPQTTTVTRTEAGITVATSKADAPDCSPENGLPPAIDESWTYTDTARTRIWYRTVDDEGVPAAHSEAVAGWISDEVETIWDDETGLLGRTPLQDVSMPCNGGDGRLDIYVMPVDGFRALTVPFPPGETLRPSFILVSAGDVDDAEEARDFVAHEFAHAIQVGAYAYLKDYMEYRWLEEATANYMVDYVYWDDQFEHEFAEKYLTWVGRHTNPIEEALGYGDPNGYEDYLYLLYVARQYGAGTIRDIWDNVESGDSLEAIEHTVPGGWKQTWPEFALQAWNRPGATFFGDEDSIPYRLPDGDTTYYDTSPQHIEIALGGANRKQFRLAPAHDPKKRPEGPHFVRERSINYLHFTFPDDSVRSFRLEDFSFGKLVDPVWDSDADPAFGKVQALLTLADGTTRVEDWTSKREVELCRDRSHENVSDLVVFYTHSQMSSDRRSLLHFPQYNEKVGDFGRALASRDCEFPNNWTGTVSGTVTGPNGELETFDATVTLERYHQDGSGALYELANAHVNWSYSDGDCSGSKSYDKARVPAIGMGIYEFGDPEVPDEYNLDLRLGGEPVHLECEGGGSDIITLNFPGDISATEPWTAGSTHLGGQETHASSWYPDWTVEWGWDLDAG